MNNKLSVRIMTSWLIIPLMMACGCKNGTTSDPILPASASDSKPDSRSFEFKYQATVTDVPENATVRVWFPVAETNRHQQVSLVDSTIPGEMQFNRDQTYGNQIGFFEIPKSDKSEVDFGLTYDVNRIEASVDGSKTRLAASEKQLYTSANSLIPLDGKPQTLLNEMVLPDDPMAAGEVLYNLVEEHMKYDKSQPGYGNGDATWACDNKTGNCTDFHSLFISLARSNRIPARFEIGFPLPKGETEGPIGGYHCWAWFFVEGKGWIPVDISEADKHPEMKSYFFGKLTTDRIAFSNGRDIELVPKSSGAPLNYFVYPYVEVDGQPWPKEKIKLNFSFKDTY